MIKTNNSKSNYFFIAWKELAVIAIVLFLDILSKFLVSSKMTLGQTVVLIPNFLNFYYTKNYDAAFNIFSAIGLSQKLGDDGMRYFFIAFVSIATLVFFTFLVTGRKSHFIYRLSLALIIGGAIGNLFDRVAHRAVRDFIQVEYFGGTFMGQRAFATFNIADSALVIGVILFLVYFIFFFAKDEKRRKQEEEKKKEPPEGAR